MSGNPYVVRQVGNRYEVVYTPSGRVVKTYDKKVWATAKAARLNRIIEK